MAGTSDGGRDEARPAAPMSEKRFEIVATVLLAVAALATAWSGYQASLWDGIQSSDYTQASAARTRAAQKHTEANQHRLADLGVFENYIDAQLDGDAELAAFYRARFSDELEPAFEAWTALDPLNDAGAPPSPLALSEYQPAPEQEARELSRRADALFAEGEDANTWSDAYTASTLLFASALFFTAISERFEYVRARVALLAFAVAGVAGGLALAISQPTTLG